MDVPLDDPEEPETPEKAPEPPRPTMVFAADKPLPEKKSVFRMFGDADDEKAGSPGRTGSPGENISRRAGESPPRQSRKPNRTKIP